MYRVLSVGRRAIGNVGIGGGALKRPGYLGGCTLLVRGLAAAGGSRIGEIVDLAARTKPLKDAVKYLQTTNDQLLIWTNSDVKVSFRCGSVLAEHIAGGSSCGAPVWPKFTCYYLACSVETYGRVCQWATCIWLLRR
mmetsp:Transcript_38655/g.152651  ORF Transcript_38655/g.152651 Transcript_38655/m.152651 type:complete len:137 (+) Transcript_38655:247-657(+)